MVDWVSQFLGNLPCRSHLKAAQRNLCGPFLFQLVDSNMRYLGPRHLVTQPRSVSWTGRHGLCGPRGHRKHIRVKPEEPLIPKHGGYRNLKSFQVSQLAYDLTVRFCNHYIERRSRTHDQMIQAARSGVQNIAEGSQVSGTSKKMEMKLTSVARASLEELKLDYEDFLRQRGMKQWERSDPRRAQLIALRPKTEDEVANWARTTHQIEQVEQVEQGTPDENSEVLGQSTQSTQSTSSTRSPTTYSEILANAALALIAVATALLDRQLEAQSIAFETDGGFTERLYSRRQNHRGGA